MRGRRGLGPQDIRALLVAAAVAIGVAACGGSGAGGGGAADTPAAPGTDTAPTTDGAAALDGGGCVPTCADRDCGPDGCGGTCGGCDGGAQCDARGRCVDTTCGGAPTTVTGPFRTGVADVAFDRATVALTHKRDVDPEEDGCVAAIDVALAAGDGCRLTLAAGGRYLPGGGLAVTAVRFTADSFCPGFLDDDEGRYEDAGALVEAAITPGVDELAEDNVAESCLATTLTIALRGELVREGDGRRLAIAETAIVVTGEFDSTGDIEARCPCRPDCAGRDCGDDGCGGTCGSCDAASRCDAATGTCACAPDCAGRQCGPDPRCGDSCGGCPAGQACSPNGRCDCAPQCGDRECGPDPNCGVSCGDCGAGEQCGADGRCECAPDCAGRVCGPDPRCGESCGTCEAGFACNAAGACDCVPDCDGIECGWEGRCNTNCGSCDTGWRCESGVCECRPDCGGRDCGPDPRCGESCGACSEPAVCENGDCVCHPVCGDRECGPDPVCGISCGGCEYPLTCSPEGRCECEPNTMRCVGSWDLFWCDSDGTPQWISCSAGPSCICDGDRWIRCAGQTYGCPHTNPFCNGGRCSDDFPN